MKNSLFILFVIIGIYSCGPNKIQGIYDIQDDDFVSTIELKNDKKFEFKYRGDACLLWLDNNGEWLLSNDTLFLIDTSEWEDEVILYEEYRDSESKDLVSVKVIDENDLPIKNVHIEYEIPDADYVDQIDSTNDIGIATFTTKKLNKELVDRQAIITIKFEDLERDIYSILLPKLSSSNITVKVFPDPLLVSKERTEKYLISGNELIALDGNTMDYGSKYIRR